MDDIKHLRRGDVLLYQSPNKKRGMPAPVLRVEFLIYYPETGKLCVRTMDGVRKMVLAHTVRPVGWGARSAKG